MWSATANYPHQYTSLGSFRNIPVALGNANQNKKVENLVNNQWTTIGDFPFVETYIFAYSFVSFQDALYLFGKTVFSYLLENYISFFKLGGNAGDAGSASTIAAKLENIFYDEIVWRNVGPLLAGRSYHRSVIIGNVIVHVGGGSGGGRD